MILNPMTAQPHPADVYSLGKTLWVLATGQAWPPEGHQPAGTRGFEIGDFRPHPRSGVLDQEVASRAGNFSAYSPWPGCLVPGKDGPVR
jgi:hypothetical protein